MLKKLLIASATTLALSSTAYASDVLTGDARLACEAILCLSSSVQPAECAPSLKRYFDIRVYRKGVFNWSRTINARKAFLAICPASNSIDTADMPKLIDDIAKGAGRCDASYLNNQLKQRKTRKECSHGDGSDNDICRNIEYFLISDKKPNYCVNYESNDLTILETAKYVGTPEEGGRWVDTHEYEAAYQKWLEEQEKKQNNNFGKFGRYVK